MPDNYEYKTSDIYFAAYLKAVGVTLLRTEEDDRSNNPRIKKLLFIFDVGSQEQLDEHKNGYFGGSGTVSAQLFVQSIRSLKSLCFI